MPWILLVIAGGLELIWAKGLKEIHGFDSLVPSLVTITVLFGCFNLLGWSLRTLTQHHAHAVWAGLATMGVILISAFWLSQGMSSVELGTMIAITGGIVGLQMTSKAEDDSASHRR